MRLHIYRGLDLDDEKVPKDVTHAIVDNNVTIIKENAFRWCKHLVSIIMGENVKRIEQEAFAFCYALRFVRFSKTLEHIGGSAFYCCESVEALFLPSAVKSIEYKAFNVCQSLRLFIPPDGVDLSIDGNGKIEDTVIYNIAAAAGVEYEDESEYYDRFTDESSHQVNEWLIHHMDESPFHKLCYSSSVTTKQINDYLIENGNNAALQVDPIHGMNPLHMLTLNPHAPAETIGALLESNTQAVFCLDEQKKLPLDYARDYNVDGLVGMVTGLCNHRNSSILVESNTNL